MRFKKNTGFTLIEILVVVSIVGLLSSIVLVASKGVREKAKIARILNFSAQIHHALGAYGVTFFDSNSESPRHLNNNDIIKDYSGNDNNGTIKYNGGGSADIISNCVNGNCLNLSGGGAYNGVGLWVPNSSKLDCVDRITIQAWINPSVTSSIRTIVDRHYNDGSIGTESSSYSFFLAGTLNFCLRFEGDSQSYCVGSLAFIGINKWQHVAATYNGSSMKIFIDGEEAERLNIPGGKKIIQSTYPIGVGVMSGGVFKFYFNGSIDEAFIYCEGF